MAVVKREIQSVVTGQRHLLDGRSRYDRTRYDSQGVLRCAPVLDTLRAGTRNSQFVHRKDRRVAVIPRNSQFGIPDPLNFNRKKHVFRNPLF